MSDRRCPSCRYALEGEARFCPRCGASAASPGEAGAAAGPAGDRDGAARLQAAVGGEFEISDLLGRGGFAEVFAARDVELLRPVAIKTIRPDLEVTPTLRERFLREARAMARLRHPNIMQVYRVGESDGVAYFVMPLVRGESLATLLERESPLSADEAARILAEAVRGLGAAHEAGTIHRDVKPGNILLDGDARSVLLGDFGIARAAEGTGASTLTRSGAFVGTPAYASPEQISGDPIDARSDLYSLGTVGYRMVGGRLPFDGSTARELLVAKLTGSPTPLGQLRADTPPRLEEAIDRCLARDPEARPDTARALLEILEPASLTPVPARAGRRPAVESGPGKTPPTGETAGQIAGRGRRRTFVLGLVSAGAVTLDLLLTGTLTASLLVVLGAAVGLALELGRLRRNELPLTAVLGLSPTGGSATRRGGSGTPEGSGDGDDPYRELAADARTTRARLLRAYGELARDERSAFPRLTDTVDRLVARVESRARQLRAVERKLDEGQTRQTSRARTGSGEMPGSGTPHPGQAARSRRRRELSEAREAAADELRTALSLLGEVRLAVDRLGRGLPSAGPGDVEALLSRCRAFLRREDEARR